ncbi:MAG: hypothetical protein WBE13_21885 [Candidatus Acidiferrum sp.]
MFFQLDEYSLKVGQILELLDNKQLERDGIRALTKRPGMGT